MRLLFALCFLFCMGECSYISIPGLTKAAPGDFVHTWTHLGYGKNDWSAPIEGKLVLLDCIGFNCTSAIPDYTFYGRRLAHGAYKAPLTAVAKPDPTKSYSSNVLGKTAFNAAAWQAAAKDLDRCAVTNVIDPSLIATGDWIGVVSWPWYIVCITWPKNSDYLKHLNDLNLKAVLFLYPLGMTYGAGFRATWFDPNPIPSIPFIGAMPQGKPISPGVPADDVAIFGLLKKYFSDANGVRSADGSVATAKLTIDPNPIIDMFNGAGWSVWWVLNAIVCACAMLCAVYLFKFKPKLLPAMMLFIEGVCANAVRMIRYVAGVDSGWFLGNGALGFNQILNDIDMPISTMGTFLTLAVWLRVLITRPLSTTTEHLYNAVWIFFSIVLPVFPLLTLWNWAAPFTSSTDGLFATKAYTKPNGVSMAGQEIAEEQMNNLFVAAIAGFALSVVAVLIKVVISLKQAGGKGLDPKMKKILSWVSFLIVCLIVEYFGLWMKIEVQNRTANYLNETHVMFWIWSLTQCFGPNLQTVTQLKIVHLTSSSSL